jgi:hypothetical protein
MKNANLRNKLGYLIKSGITSISLMVLISRMTLAFEPHFIAQLKGRGQVQNELVGPGALPGKQVFYQSYINVGGTLDIVAIDPANGNTTIYECPVQGEGGAYGMVVGPDNKLYIGTHDNAFILRLDPGSGKFENLGRPSPTETYIWSLVVGADNKIYGSTYPNAKIIRVDPETGRLEDLGIIDETEKYNKYMATSVDGFVYAGTGPQDGKIVAYEISTGDHRVILDTQSKSFPRVYRAVDNRVYVEHNRKYYRLTGFSFEEITQATLSPRIPQNVFSDDRKIVVDPVKGNVKIIDSLGVSRNIVLDYEGRPQQVFRFASGPDGMIYGSGILPFMFFRVNPESSDISILGKLGGGEAYAMMSSGQKFYMANYAGNSRLMVYDPFKAYAPESSNPFGTGNALDSGWRPEAMIAGPTEGILYVGSKPGYGDTHGGPLVEWDTHGDIISSFIPVPDESPVTLVRWKGKIIGGTTIVKGSGTNPTETEPSIFIWDPASQTTEYTMKVPFGSEAVSALVLGPNGKVYGFAGSQLIVFNPETQELTLSGPRISGFPIYNSTAVGPDGNIWGISKGGVFRVNTSNDSLDVFGMSVIPTGGFVLAGNKLFFASTSDIYSYTINVPTRMDDTFDMEGDGSPPSKWTIKESAATAVAIVNDVFNGSTGKSVHLIDSSAIGACEMAFTSGPVDKFEFHGSYRFKDVAGPSYVFLGNGNASSIYLVSAVGGQWKYFNGTSYIRFPGDLDGVVPHQWYEVRIAADFNTLVFNVWINGKPIGTDIPIPGLNNKLTGFRILPAHTPGKGEMWVDDIHFTDNPEYVPDETPPSLLSVGANIHSISSATIAWNTDEPADARVEYGVTSAYGNATAIDSLFSLLHERTLRGLFPSRTYHYRVKSKDVNGNQIVSEDKVFVTPALTVFEDDFEKDSIGAPPHFWELHQADGTHISVVSGDLHGKSGRVAHLKDTSVTEHTHLQFWCGQLNKFEFSSKIRFKEATGPHYVFLGNGSAGSLWLVTATNGKWQYFNGSVYNQFEGDLDGFEANKWYEIRVSGDFGAQVYSVWVNGRNIGSNIPIPGSNTYLKGFRLLPAGTAGKGEMWVDEISVTDGSSYTPDFTAPGIDNIDVSGITTVSATVSWVTDEPSDTQVEYGLSVAYGSTTALGRLYGTTHSQGVIGLTSGSVYHYRVKSRDANGILSVSADNSFRTNSLPDNDGPSVLLSTPGLGSIYEISQTVSILADAADISGVTKVWFLLDGVVVATDTTLPFGYSWPITEADNGSYEWTATAFDAVGNSSTSVPVLVTVNIDETPPFIRMTGPSQNTTFTTPQTIPITVSASDSGWVSKVWFVRNGVTIATATAEPYEYAWPITGANNGSHTWSATAFDAMGNSSSTVGVPVMVNIDVTAPSVPTSVQALKVTSSTVSFSWTPSTDNVGVAGYRIRRASSVIATVPGEGNAFTESGLSPNTSYAYAVLAFDAAGNESAFTPDLVVTTPRPPLVSPSGSVTGVTAQSITLRWAATPYATRYTLAGSLSDNTVASFALQRESSGTDDSLSGLTPNTTYYLFLNACDETHCSEFELANSAITLTVPPTLKSVLVRGHEAHLTINPQGNPAGTVYRIEMSRSGGEFSSAATGTGLTFVVTGLNPGERYQFRVTAENHGGVKSSYSNVVAAALAPNTVDGARAFPSPFRPGQGADRMTFDKIPAGTPLRIFTVDGRPVTTLTTDSEGSVQWDLTNDAGLSRGQRGVCGHDRKKWEPKTIKGCDSKIGTDQAGDFSDHGDVATTNQRIGGIDGF